MAIVLFNIGWMNRYRGQTRSDRIINGGSFVAKHRTPWRCTTRPLRTRTFSTTLQ